MPTPAPAPTTASPAAAHPCSSTARTRGISRPKFLDISLFCVLFTERTATYRRPIDNVEDERFRIDSTCRFAQTFGRGRGGEAGFFCLEGRGDRFVSLCPRPG